MKIKFYLFILFSFNYINTDAQIKMVAKSTYSFNGTGFAILDTSIYFNNPANPNPVNENFTDAYNYAIYDSSHYYYYNQTTQTLDFITRSIVTFDAGFAHQTLAKSYNYTNNINDTRDDYSNFYTGNNLDSQYFEHTILSPLSTIFYSKNFIHYNAGNNADTIWYVNFQNGNYFKTNKYCYTFNAQNLIDTTIGYESVDSINYSPKIISKNFYNLNGSIDSTVSYYWLSGIWNKYAKKQYSYNGSNMRTLSETLSFNSATNVYTPSNRIQYLRNNGTLMDSTFHQSYNSTTQKYDTLNKYGFIHYNGLLLHQHSYTFNQVTNVWENTPQVSIINYYYNMMPNSTSELRRETSDLRLYPNPCETYLTIKTPMLGAQFAIYSTDGKFMQSGTINKDQKVFVQTLPEGMYIFKSTMKGKTMQELFIKQ